MGESMDNNVNLRLDLKKQHPSLRIKHFREFVEPYGKKQLKSQGARCMDCGVPFCHQGCPLGNLIPEWNELVSQGHWRQALEALLSTNNFPEFTGRICPAPCESACILGINEDPVSIENIEMALADMGFENGWIKPEPPEIRTGKKIAIIGSGPAGLAAAQQLNRLGHRIDVLEKADRPGGLLMYGIPDFKLEKSKVLRRIHLLEKEGITFKCGINVGEDILLPQLQNDYDAVLLAMGAGKKRDISIEGRQFRGVHYAEDFLEQSTRRQFSDEIDDADHEVLATDKHVIVIGGGDTGSDCIGTSNRQKALSVTQFEIMPRPPELGRFPRASDRPEDANWLDWPVMLRTSSSHEEGVERHWALRTTAFIGDDKGYLKALETEKVEVLKDGSGNFQMKPVPNSKRQWPCDLALIAIGFEGPQLSGLIQENSIELTSRNLVKSNHQYMTNLTGVFTAGDMRRGQSLVVWAIAEGRKAAESIHAFLS